MRYAMIAHPRAHRIARRRGIFEGFDVEIAEPDHLIPCRRLLKTDHRINARITGLPFAAPAALKAEPARIMVNKPVEIRRRYGEVMDTADHRAVSRAARTAAAISALRGLRRNVSPPFTCNTCPVMKH